MEVSQDLTSTALQLKCWVPICSSTSGQQQLFSLPDNSQTREIWLALAGRAITSFDERICFCSEHFSVSFKKPNSET